MEFSVKGTKNASSSGFFFYFDHLEAAIQSDVQDPTEVYSNVSAAIDYDIDHTYKLFPQRLIWNLDRLGLRGPVNEYMGVFWRNQRKRSEGVFRTQTVQVGGTWGEREGVFLQIGNTVIGKTTFPADTLAIIAAHFKHVTSGS